MTRKYIIPVLILLSLGIVLMILPGRERKEEISPEEVLRSMTGSSRLTSPDRVADRLINKDPSLLLIDVRTPEEYSAYSLPGAFNIPIAGLLDETSLDLLSQEGMDVVFFGNDELLADRAWLASRRKGLKDVYVLEGGLNQWFDNFFTLSPPPESASAAELEHFQFRMGVRQYLTGGELQVQQQQPAETITIKPKTKKSATEGGC
jgi:rhodanese-related sulfurtransferase